jgi:WD40 repeat protein/serine/threonine protein kinase
MEDSAPTDESNEPVEPGHGRQSCTVCGTPIYSTAQFCPVCMFRGALDEENEAFEFSPEQAFSESASELERQRFDNYELLKGEDGVPIELGRGAMGITYKAVDVDLHCFVTLKVISEKYLGDEAAKLRFLREARAAASFRHPNVASVFHLGKTDQNYFYTMEFVEGETLENLIKRLGQLEVKLALEIATQVAAGLGALDKQNLVHRDIKPSNIMVSLEGEGAGTVKIIDLGLAKVVTESQSDAAISIPGVFAGTPEYASPEQFAGVGVGICSDLYSLAITLWEMLTGQVPFRGSPAEVMHQHQYAPLPVQQLKSVPQPVVVLLEVLLDKEPANRFQAPVELLKVMPLVKDAIDGGRRLMKTIRVFISATGDVQKERIVADRVMHSIAEEFNLPISAACSNFQRLAEENDAPETDAENHTALVLCPCIWEYQRVGTDAGYQRQIPNIAEFDLVICILWSRLGSPFAQTLKTPDGSPPGSGAEYEIAWALDQARKKSGVPTLHVYRNCSQPTPPLEPKEELEAFCRQWNSLQEAFTYWENNSETNLAGAFSNYRNLEEFEELFRNHFRDFLASKADRQVGENIPHHGRRWKSSPFRGLNFFDFEHALIFHGRTKAIGEVLEALEAQVRAQRPFVLVVGASGSGKSSLVRAGVLPLLTQPGTVEGIGFWRWSVTRPGAGGAGGDCFDALAAALLEPAALPALEDPESPNPIRDLGSELRRHSDSVALRVRDALDHAAREWKIQHSQSLEERERHFGKSQRSGDADLGRLRRESLELPKARFALVVDQLEELFTTGFSPEIRQNYISVLAGLVRSGRVFVIATLRSDFYPRYQEFPDLTELAQANGKVDLRPPTIYEIGNMIRLPAEAAGLHFEQERKTGQRLDEALRDAASATPESLPLLEHVLSLLYDEQNARSDGMLRWSDYRQLGELKGALAKHAEGVFSTLQPQEQKAFSLVMRHLVTLGQGEEEVPNRRTAPYRDFVASEGPDHVQKAAAKGFVDLFIEQRLLVADADPQGEVTVSVAHEALLREWQRVQVWLTENREFLRMRDRLELSLKLWLSRGKLKDDLLEPGLHLAEGEKLVKDFGPSLNKEQIDYVQASISERKRRRQARERIRYSLLAAMTVLTLVAGFQWLRAESQRQIAAQAFKSEAQVTAKLQEQLRQASWASFNQAERQFQLGEWREGIAILARAIKFDPGNQVAAERFFHELIVHRQKALPAFIATLDHQGSVNDVAFSPDGTRILTASWDKTAKLWDAVSGKLVISFAHQGIVWRAAFNSDGTRVLTASADKTAKLWDAASGTLIASFAHQAIVYSAVFSPDGALILTASADKTARLWDAASGRLIATFAHDADVNDAQFSPDGALILSASADKTAKLWDAASGNLIASFAHEGIVSHAEFSPDGARILTASADHSARLWDVVSARLIASFDHQDSLYGAVFSPDGTRILTASADDTAKLWDATSAKLIASFVHQGLVFHAAFSADGARILTASADNTAKLWDAASGALIASFDHQDLVNDAAFSPDGTRILTASADHSAKIWDAPAGEPIASCAHQDGLYRAAFSPDGTRILTASADKTAKLWEAGSGKLIATFGHLDSVNDAAFSPDGARVLTASADKTAKLWEAASGKLVASFGHQDEIFQAAFSPDGARVLTASGDKTAKLWEAASGKLMVSFAHQDSVNDAVFSPDGARILTASADHSAKLWEAATGKLIASFAHQDSVNDAAFSPDGARILTASADHSAKLWEAASSELIASFDHQDEVFRAAFSPGGTRILTASADKTAKLWEAASGKLIASFAHQASVYYAAFSSDGARILTASADKTAKLWEAASGKLIVSFDHQDTVRWAAFSPDGAQILTASWDKSAKLWDAVTPTQMARLVKESGGAKGRNGSPVAITSSVALQVELFSDIASGLRFSDDGVLVAIDEERRSRLTRQLKDLTPDLRPNSRFLPWFFSTGGERTIFPASDVHVAEWVDNALLSNPYVTEEWLRNALIFLPNHSLLHIALAGFETGSKRADFLRSFGLVRLPTNSAVCTRAGEMLVAQHRPELGLVAVDKALLADPTNLTAQRFRLNILDAMSR